jgi:hypothetical protein
MVLLSPTSSADGQAHRLKNDRSKIYSCASKFPTRLRYGLTGTPMQVSRSPPLLGLSTCSELCVSTSGKRPCTLPSPSTGSASCLVLHVTCVSPRTVAGIWVPPREAGWTFAGSPVSPQAPHALYEKNIEHALHDRKLNMPYITKSSTYPT